MKPILYIIVRNDLKWSLNAGKAMAQVSHASAQFVTKMMEMKYKAYDSKCEKVLNSLELQAFNQWITEGNGFGTTIVLEADCNQIEKVIENYQKDILLDKDTITTLGGEIIDDTYPIMIPYELIDKSSSKQEGLEIDYTVYNNCGNEKGLVPCTIKQHTCSWLFLFDEQIIESFREFCKERIYIEKGIGLAR